jgi:protein TonB
MFDQTLLPERHETRKPLSLLTSLAFQFVVVGLVLLLSMLSSERLPLRQLKSILLPPTPPASVHNVATETVERPLAARVRPLILNFQKFTFRPESAVQTQASGAPMIAGVPDSDAPVTGLVGDVLGSIGNSAPPPAQPKPKQTPQLGGPMRLTSSLAAANLIYQVRPAYPPLAKTARIQGTVQFSAIIGKDGRIKNLQVAKGHPLLIQSATEAVLQWRYRPTLLNGTPVEVATEIIVNFRLGE